METKILERKHGIDIFIERTENPIETPETTHRNINIVVLDFEFSGFKWFIETTATPDKVHLSDFNNDMYKKRCLMSIGNSGIERHLKNTKITGFKIKGAI